MSSVAVAERRTVASVDSAIKTSRRQNKRAKDGLDERNPGVPTNNAHAWMYVSSKVCPEKAEKAADEDEDEEEAEAQKTQTGSECFVFRKKNAHVLLQPPKGSLCSARHYVCTRIWFFSVTCVIRLSPP